MSIERSVKYLIAVFFLVAAGLLGIYQAVQKAALGDWALPVILLLVGIGFIVWARYEERVSEAAALQVGDEAAAISEPVKHAEIIPAQPAEIVTPPPAKIVVVEEQGEAKEETPPEPVEAAAPAEPPKEAAPPEPAPAEPVEAAAPPEPPKKAAKPEPAKAAAKPDDLTRIEGIGPKMSAALIGGGIDTFDKLAKMSEDDLRAVISSAGMRFAPSIPTWAQQASYAAKGDWDGLEQYQGTLDAGRPTAAEPVVLDDLKRIEGIGPKYHELLVGAGIDTFNKLAKASVADLEAILSAAGSIRPASLDTWAEQAALAAKGDWEGLAALQSTLKGGRRE